MKEIPEGRETYTAEPIKSDIDEAMFLGNPVLDNVVNCLVALGSEVWACKRRTKVLEAVLAKKGISQEEIERYQPSAAEVEAWEEDRDRFLALAMGPLGFQSHVPASARFSRK
ncbi:hypothetical protein FV139_14705 [Parahaliea maris]|uniref:Uncharacterized protein n=1 Tax=Parahaliea maris TaxID=2716870 RepID=A0A5C8ZTZ6_9GAMM|nr:hypothetical protein [Parahaliea maris]TXS91973.1 hypothetical protein FV139_14705 [Parahaliea maris]